MPMIRIVPRGFTTAADAYLTPHIARYIKTFLGGFTTVPAGDGDGDGGGLQRKVLFMRSDGGLAHVGAFSGHCAILSGPAGGVVGAAATAYAGWHRWGAAAAGGAPPPIIGFDMGGTSTDVSRYAVVQVVGSTCDGVAAAAV